ncbi:MAG: integrase, partial [Firmicutes bacterium]|nr:integrase [Bacillota bacterium]
TKPYAPVGSMYHIVSRFLTRIGIEPSQGKIKGSHLFRYSLTKRLLEIKVPHQIITDALGHSSKDSDKYYYSLEDEMLRKCCLDARWIGVKSWK